MDLPESFPSLSGHFIFFFIVGVHLEADHRPRLK
ncbi:uncharacterized protein CCOS01_01518 [Colletotrichum costaricense]|uniref:Uncharacterized protein n=2 Tax=Colletotrichum acutatum species complex TaxID=2707335 RepID=A0AAI9ZB38_9PEZI|nr:uncharacterized protein CCOS01_01518 [Colletotrichum costaricense]XP_060379368.1 uncharacterized protein CTAM01_10024 [Colletotrichum tamarilloi]KAK1492230.1 hypothetical protein CTAM01_10024 [Colletotrichum tamarilloi]KAK1540204.1 hypothetical protein CCOS01_01518 [Colletotrichum costaricense]